MVKSRDSSCWSDCHQNVEGGLEGFMHVGAAGKQAPSVRWAQARVQILKVLAAASDVPAARADPADEEG